MSSKLRIVVLGMMGRCPYGGQTWLYLNWLLGLSRLGHDVWYVEDDSVWPYDPEQNCVTDDGRYAVRHISTCMDRIGLADKWAFRLIGSDLPCQGITDEELKELYTSCDVLLNIVGATDLREDHMNIPMRVYVETDPVTAELLLAHGDEHTREAFDNHQFIVTYGENYESEDCGVPLNGLEKKYRKTRQPIDVGLWPMAYEPNSVYFTTIGNYRQSGNDVEYNGEVYHWSKHHEWEKFINLPNLTKQKFKLAMMPEEPADQETLVSRGWHLIPPLEMSLDIFGAYTDFFRHSRGAFTVAKDQNVRLRSGWFSEREACYLACGKPVVTQDTGFSNILPTGMGLFGIETVEDACAAIDNINANYSKHCEAARDIAVEYFRAESVAAKLLRDVGLV